MNFEFISPPPLQMKKLGRPLVVPSLKIVINLPRTYEKLHNKEEPYRFSGFQDPSANAEILLTLYKDR